MREIGRGGMGTVHQAIDERLRCPVALKRMKETGPESRTAFEHEARVLAGLRHPVLPLVTDHFVEGSDHYLVMQYIPGTDLGAGLAQRGSAFPAADVLAWVRPLLDALAYLHARGIVHRDIKPTNVRLTPDGEVVLLDFGLAKGGAGAAGSGASIFGYTPRYAPPEQIAGRTTDPRSDLYALGATLHHLLAGAAPPSATERLAALGSGQTDPLPALEGVPAGLAESVRRALALDPSRRFASASEMRDALAAGSPAPERAADRDRRLDAASPAAAEVGRPIDVIAQVRFAESPRLGLEDWPTRRKPAALEQGSESVRVEYPLDPATGRVAPARLELRVIAPSFAVEGPPTITFEVPPDRYSPRASFLLTPSRTGAGRIQVEAYGPGSVYLGAVALETEVGGVAETPALRTAELRLEVAAQVAALLATATVAASPPISAAPPAPARASRVPPPFLGGPPAASAPPAPPAPPAPSAAAPRPRPARRTAIGPWALAAAAAALVAVAVPVLLRQSPPPAAPPSLASPPSVDVEPPTTLRPATPPPASVAPARTGALETAAEARAARDAWVKLAAEGGRTREADAARVRALECGREAWRLGGEDADRQWLLRTAESYLRRPDARQADRVRAILRQARSPAARH